MTGSFRRLAATAVVFLMVTGVVDFVRASDHNDGNGTFPGWDLGGRRDANITNFFAFGNASPNPDTLILVLLLTQGITDPGYFFAEDLTLRFHIDRHSEVTFTDGDPTTTTDDWMMRFGGTVTDVDKITDDIVFEVSFKPTHDGKTAPRLSIQGLPSSVAKDIAIFPQEGESPVRRFGNAVLAMEVPLAPIVMPDRPGEAPVETLLIWATSKVPEVHGSISDHMGMPNTSNQRENLLINRLRPREQAAHILARPPDLFLQALPGNPVSLAPYADVLIYNLARPPRAFPPGRGNPNLPSPPGFVQFNPLDATKFPNGRPADVELRANVFPYIAPQ